MAYIGDFALGSTFDTKFTTVNTSGVPTQLAGTPAISAYPDNSTTELTAGITLTADFDTRTGLNNVRVVATSGNGYAAGSNYQLVITTGTVSGSSVVGYVVGEFSIEARSSLRPTTAGRTLDVSATGEAGLDWANIGSPTTSQTLSGTSISTLSSTGDTNVADALLKRDMSAVTGEAARSPLNALRFLRNKWSIAATTLTVTKEDDATSAWTSTITTDGAANPITASDPA